MPVEQPLPIAGSPMPQRKNEHLPSLIVFSMKP
jgi:hypothetical protein